MDTDLIVLNAAHPPLMGFPGLHSGLRTIIRASARPIMTVAENTTAMDNALLAFDGSDMSREALFVATYLAEKWRAKLIVLTIGTHAPHSVQDYARSYLELHEIKADYIIRSGSRDIFLKIIQECQINLPIALWKAARNPYGIITLLSGKKGCEGRSASLPREKPQIMIA